MLLFQMSYTDYTRAHAASHIVTCSPRKFFFACQSIFSIADLFQLNNQHMLSKCVGIRPHPICVRSRVVVQVGGQH